MLETERLILRQWRNDDYIPYAKLNADPTVMRFFPSTLSEQESNEQADRIKSLINNNGYGFWAVELKSSGKFIGFVGLHEQDEQSGIPNSPLIEVGWRLSAEHWGLGYAPEAAEVALAFAFEKLSSREVYAFTALPNEPSQRVMEKIGMDDIDQDFNHPKLPSGHVLERHCLYKITKEQWLEKST